ncbi:MAG: hypothetical protein ACTHKB_10765, partial [Burkholderiaceae bacterium]
MSALSIGSTGRAGCILRIMSAPGRRAVVPHHPNSSCFLSVRMHRPGRRVGYRGAGRNLAEADG